MSNLELNLTYFSPKEFACKETGENNMDSEFLLRLDKLRGECGFPFRITSGYRSTEHSVERKKPRPGTHTKGIAADIACTNSFERYKIIEEALKLGFTGIGIAKSFVHVDTRKDLPRTWVYS